MSDEFEKCDHECDDCGCDCDSSTFILDFEDGSSMECSVISIFPVDGRDYIALLPLDTEETDEEDSILLYRCTTTEDNELELSDIETDEEYAAVAEAVDAMLDDEEYDELFEDEDDID